MTSWLRRALPFLPKAELRFVDATPQDASAIAALHSASFRRGWSEDEIDRLLIERNVLVQVARLGRRTVGFILSRHAADEAEILSVATAPRAQGRGIGRELLTLHLRRLAGLGIHAVFLEVDESNTPARRLYDRAGFREVAKRPAYYGGGSGSPAAAVVLRRDLA